MSTKLHIPIFIVSLIISFSGLSQQKAPISVEKLNSNFFSKGTSLINLLQGVSYTHLKSNQENAQTNNNLNINLRANYFVTDNIGVVAGYHNKSQKSFSEFFSSETINNYGLFELGGIYGFQPEFINETPVSVQLTFGFGGSRINDFKSSVFATEISLSSYHKVSKSGLYVSPTVGFGFISQSAKDSELKINSTGFFAGVGLVKPFGCGEYLCAFDDEESDWGYYNKGSNIIAFSQNGLFSTGKVKVKDSFEFNNTKLDLKFADYHYVLDNLAVGAGIDLQTNTINNKANNKTSTLGFSFMPMVRYHAPIEGPLNHIYANGGLIFGVNNSITTFNGNETKNNNGIFGYELGLGYNVPFTERLTFSIEGSYIGTKVKNKANDTDFNNNGFRFLYGLNFAIIP